MRHLMLIVAIAALAACAMPKVKIGQDFTEPLREFVLKGNPKAGKVLIVPVDGFIDQDRKFGLLGSRPSIVQEVVSQLEKAARDRSIKAVVVEIDSPGGTATASDTLFNEVERYRERSGAKIVSLLMNLATSGGYYVALAGDRIVAHPTTVTGSVGAIFLRPKVQGLMGKVGVEAEVTKSGVHKDMGSPFRETTDEERRQFASIIEGHAKRFQDTVLRRRGLPEEARATFSDARIMAASEALSLKLVDRVGYFEDAIEEARALAGLSEDAAVVVFRREAFADDNVYNTATASGPGRSPSLVDLGVEHMVPVARAGFYYLWLPSVPGD